MPLTVFCLCADWCDTCRSFQSTFEQLAQQNPEQRYVWIDVEVHDQCLADIDIENFPTIVITDQINTYFFGPILPHAETLERLCRAAQTGDLPLVQDTTLNKTVQQLLLFQNQTLK